MTVPNPRYDNHDIMVTCRVRKPRVADGIVGVGVSELLIGVME